MTGTCDPSLLDCTFGNACAGFTLTNEPKPRVIRFSEDALTGCCPSFVARFEFYQSDMVAAKVTVGPPWKIVKASDIADNCSLDLSPAASGCMILGAFDTNFWVFTTDPNAPVRNLAIQEVPPGTTCN